jgi:asparagine synthase (glutamine-hydrolysing)
LRAQLKVAFRTRSEVETLLHLYIIHGTEMFQMLNGQFAIAIWDGRGSDTLIMARDGVGIRPLFWHCNGTRIAFASEMKALFAKGDVPAILNRESLVQTFRFLTNVGETTAFSNVHQIPAGHYLVAGADKITLTRYWDWPFEANATPIHLPSDEDYFERFCHELKAAINRQRMADVPIGAYLSGGIDSTATAALLQEQKAGAALTTFSVTFDDPEYDERAAQQAVIKHFGFDHTTANVPSAKIGATFPQVVWHAEAFLYTSAPTPLFLLADEVHKKGMKVVMTGEGADEVLLGYFLFRETKIRRFWSHQVDSAWRGQLFRKLYDPLPQFRNPDFNEQQDFYRPFLKNASNPHYAMAVRWANGKSLEYYFSPDMQAFAENYDPVATLERSLAPAYAKGDDIARAQHMETLTLLANYLLSSQGDRMSMAHAVEGRYPYLDQEFIAFCARLPRSMKLRGLQDKFVLRQALSDRIPEAIRFRPKVAYGAPGVKGFVQDGRVPEYVEELFSRDRIKDVGIFNPDRVAMLLSKARASDLGRAKNRDNMAFMLVLSSMLLHEIFVRGNMMLNPLNAYPQHIELLTLGSTEGR